MKVAAARTAIAEAKATIGSLPEVSRWEALKTRAEEILSGLEQHRLQGVINATGVLLHTNLGRAPLSPGALQAVERISLGYSNLEYNTQTAERGSRYDHATDLLCRLTGAEAALVVNNNAAAVLLALASTASGKEVVVSRGELIEIGGGFRIPEIMAQSSAVLREVGTTNRTRLSDYAKAVNENTAMLMKIHPSNYRIEGFASSVPSSELAALAAERGLKFIHDVGSGLLRRSISGNQLSWLESEPTVVESVKEGADLVCFSADKLLGGPQAGILAGKKKSVRILHRSPLLRAFRIDKMSLAALESTLLTYINNSEADLPLWRMALIPKEQLEKRARKIKSALDALPASTEVVDGDSTLGGGSAPGSAIPTALLQICPARISVDDLQLKLASSKPSIVARINNDTLVFDLRTVDPNSDQGLTDALVRAL